MSIDCELSVNIANEREAVWNLLNNATTWKTWWPDCIDAASTDRKTLHEGSELELVLQPGQRKYTFRPVVDLHTEAKMLSLTHRSTLLQWTLSWYLNDAEMGTRVTVQGVFAGFDTLLMKLFRQDDAVRFSLHGNLRGLKKLAERMV